MSPVWPPDARILAWVSELATRSRHGEGRPETNRRDDRNMNITRTTAFIGTLLLSSLIAGCATQSGPVDETTSSSAGKLSAISPVVLLGDSISVGLSVPLTEAFAASGEHFQSLASEGGGNVVGPFADDQWETLPGDLAAAAPGLIVYQITTYDWGTEAEQQAGYERLVDTAADVGAELLFVTMPPIRADDFYEPHLDDLHRTAEVAAAVAEASRGQAAFLDASEVWGTSYAQDRDGAADRSSDGIHVCPQGAARYSAWLLDKIHAQHPDFTPASADRWANTGWASSDAFIGCF